MKKNENHIKHPIVSIVDDNPSLCDSLKMLFESAEFDAEVFASAEEFLSTGKLAESRFLILDVQLPGMSGIKLQNLLRAQGNNINVIFITAHPSEHNRQLAMQDGATHFFSKPFRGIELLTAAQSPR